MGGARTVALVAVAGLVAACGRLDLRELVPAAALPVERVGAAWRSVVLVAPALAELPSGAGPGSAWAVGLPGGVGEALRNLPIPGLFAPAEAAPWLRAARRDNGVVPALVRALAGRQLPVLAQAAPAWALSAESGYAAAARRQGYRTVLVVQAAAGPEDARAPIPAVVSVSAEVAVLDTAAVETLGRAYDRVSVRVLGDDPEALRRALARAGRHLGERLLPVLGERRAPPPRAIEDEDEP